MTRAEMVCQNKIARKIADDLQPILKLVNIVIKIYKMQKGFRQKWDTLSPNDIPFFNKNFKEISSSLLQFLILSLFDGESFEIGTFREDQAKGSIVSYDIYDNSKELNLNYHTNDVFKLQLKMHDWDDNLKTYSHILNDDNLKMIPKGLMNLMKECCRNNKSMTVSKNQITN